MAQHPRRGDRQRARDDRGLMLDLLLAARHSLYLSHTGRSVRDNTQPAAVGAGGRAAGPAGAGHRHDPASTAVAGAGARSVWWSNTPLQPFAPQAFDPRAMCGCAASTASSPTRCATAWSAAQPGRRRRPVPIDDPEDDGCRRRRPGRRAAQRPSSAHRCPRPRPEWRQVTLAQLVEFFRNPCRALLRRRLGIELARDADELQDDEPFLPDGRARAATGRRLLPPLAAGRADCGHCGAGPCRHRDARRRHRRSSSCSASCDACRRLPNELREATAQACLPPQSAAAWTSTLDGETW